MRLLRLIAVFVMAGLAGGAGQALAGVLIEVNKATQRISVSIDGEEVASGPVATYVDMMRHNIRMLAAGLTPSS